jgi:uncharacterized SAM-binding protein YcdF (DUF218 family)
VSETASDFVKALLIPGSMSFLVLGMGLGVLLLYSTRLQPWGRRWLVFLLLLYLALGMPVVSDALQRERGPSIKSLENVTEARGARTVVVLGNGALTYTDGISEVPALTRRTAFNIMEGARLYHLLGRPRLILTGGIVNPEIQKQSEAELMADAILRLGIPRDALALEGSSRNTYEQSVRVAAMVPPGSTVVVVTTPIHTPRTVQLFEARGLHVIASPCRIDYGPDSSSPASRFVPNASSLRASELAFNEYLAMANGRARGWLARSDTLQ